MGGVPGGMGDIDYSGYTPLRTSSSSGANDKEKYPGWFAQNTEYPVYSSFDITMRGGVDDLSITGVYILRGPVGGNIVDGTNEYGGAYGRHLFQTITLTSTITFNKQTGAPLSIEGGTPVRENIASSYGLMFGGTQTYPPSQITLEGKSFGRWRGSANLRWPMWQISGSQFRFFGQNWIRLIKVSGP